METVELLDASFFECPSCGTIGWIKWARIEDPARTRQLEELVGLRCDRVAVAPLVVSCKQCEKTFGTFPREDGMGETVELHDAFFFICPECGETGWVKGVHVDLSQEDMEDLEEDTGPLGAGVLMRAPDSVTCKKCNKTFKALMEGDDGEEEDDGREEWQK